MSLKWNLNGRYHRYWLDGQEVKSVTTVLNSAVAKPALKWWAAKVVAEYIVDHPDTLAGLIAEDGRESVIGMLTGAVKDVERTAKARGTDVHRLAEQVVHGEPVVVPGPIRGHVDGYARWLDRVEFVPELVERPVGNRAHWYAGRFDVLGTIGGERWLLDIKTGSGIYAETVCQVAAYARAEFWSGDDEVEHPMPVVDRIGAIHVTDHSTELFDLGDVDEGFAVFTHLQAVYRSWPDLDARTRVPVVIADARGLF
jgi:hypothetical protein